MVVGRCWLLVVGCWLLVAVVRCCRLLLVVVPDTVVVAICLVAVDFGWMILFFRVDYELVVNTFDE